MKSFTALITVIEMFYFHILRFVMKIYNGLSLSRTIIHFLEKDRHLKL